MIGRSDVEVWIARLDRVPERDAASLAAICAPEEHARAARLPLPEERHRRLVARGAVRALLAGALGASPEGVRLRRDPGGKPRLAAPFGHLRFSVSHSRDIVAVGLALGREVGVDVEVRDARLDVDAIVRRVLPRDEARRLLALPPAARRAAFFSSWSRREALAKADGRGLRGAPLSPDGRWSVADVKAPEGYVVAVAAEGHDWRAVRRTWIPGITTPLRPSVHREPAGSRPLSV